MGLTGMENRRSTCVEPDTAHRRGLNPGSGTKNKHKCWTSLFTEAERILEWEFLISDMNMYS